MGNRYCTLEEVVMIKQKFCMSQMNIPGAFFISSICYNDNRGETMKEYASDILSDNGIEFSPLETLVIESKQYVLRGLHFQQPKWQSRLVTCISGELWCVILDLRENSSSYGAWIAKQIGYGQQLFIPTGCAFGSLALQDSLFLCSCGDNKYDRRYASGINWMDPTLNINYPVDSNNIIVSDTDQLLLGLKDYKGIK